MKAGLVSGRIALLLTFLLLPSCSEDPTLLNSLDTKFTDADITVIEDTLNASWGSSFRQYLPMSGSRNMVGRVGDLSGILIMQFIQLPVRDTVEILSATIQLRSVTWTGDSTGTLAFTVHKVNRVWGPLTLTWDTVVSPGFYESEVSRGSYSGTVAADTEFVSFAVDTGLVRTWFQETQSGILLLPDPTQGGNLARGFTAFGTDSTQNLPTLTVISRNLAGTVTDTASYSLGNDTFAGNIDGLVSDPGQIYVQAGVVYRSRLVFDASPIPAGAIINQADLLLWIDDAASMIGKFSADTLLSVHAMTSSDSTQFELVGSVAQEGLAGSILFDVRHAAQLWVNGTNNGLLLRASSLNEFSSLDQYIIHGPASPEAQLRARVRVLYSVENRTR